MRAAAFFAVFLVALTPFGANGQSTSSDNDPQALAIERAWRAYENGEHESALRAFELLAADGVVQAQLNLGYMHAAGEGTAVDLAESRRYFRMAAEQGHVGAQNVLGLYYYNGEGVERDVVAAHAWFTLAATGGHPQADDYRMLVEKSFSPAQMDEAHKLAKKLYASFGERRNLW